MSEKRRRNRMVNVRLLPEEYGELAQRAQGAGMSLPAFARSLIFKTAADVTCSHGVHLHYRCRDCEGWTDMESDTT